MKPKQIFILSIILIVLAGLVIWKNYRPSPVVGYEESVRLNARFDSKLVTEIRIGKSGAEVLLKKEQDGWRVPARRNAGADNGKVAQLLEVLSSLRGEIRSEREDLLPDYDIGNDNALQIALSASDKPLFELVIGLNRPDSRGIFFRLKESSVVYFSNDQLLAHIGLYGNIKTEVPKADFWLDLRLVDLNIEQVTSFSLIQMKNGKEIRVFDFQKSGDSAAVPVWKSEVLGEDFKVDGSKIKTYLRKFQYERAKEILDPAMQYGFEAPDFKLLINEGEAERIILFKKHDTKTGDHAVSVLGHPEVKLMSAAGASAFQVDSSFFQQEEAKTA